MRTPWIIPDIHGEYDKFMVLLQGIGYDPAKDKLIILGDMVDRGPDSRLLLKYLMTLQEQGNIILRGNHEIMMIDAVEAMYDDYVDRHDPKISLWLSNGGGQTLRSYGKAYPYPVADEVMLSEVRKHVQWLKTLPLYYETETHFFSHAPVPSRLADWQLAKSSEEILTWSYGQPEDSFAKKLDNKIGICGHIHALERGVMLPRFYPHYYYLDSGCGCSRNAPLIALNLDENYYLSSRSGPMRYPVKFEEPIRG